MAHVQPSDTSEPIEVSDRHLRWLQQRQIVRKKCADCGLYHSEEKADYVHTLLRRWGA